MLMDLLDKIVFALDGFIYPLIPEVYSVFYDLATGKFFSDEIIQTITGNIYVFVSVVMLFAFGVQLIQAIVNPDKLSDDKKGTTGFIKRMVIAVVLITTIPIMFSSLDEIQKNILDNNIIEKVIMGMNGNSKKKGSAAAKTGQYIAGSALSIVLYPNENAETEYKETVDAYTDAVTKDVSRMKDIEDVTEEYGEDDNEKKVFHFETLASLVVGGFLLYTVIMFTFDMALRLVKMAFLEITAPVSIISYIISGSSALNKWFKELMSTFAGVFIKIAVFSFVIIGIQALQPTLSDPDKNWVYKVFLLIGLLMFAKQLPSMIQNLFGINIDSKGGIKGRLSSMAGVGGLAARAFDKTKALGVAGAAALGGAAIGAGKGLGRLGKWGARKIDTKLNNSDGKAGRVYRGAKGKVVGAKNYVKGKADQLNATKAGQFVENASTKAGQYIKESPGIQRAASTLKAGVTAKNATEAAKGMYKAYKEDPLTQQLRAQKLGNKNDEITARIYESAGIDKDTNKVNAVERESGVVRKAAAAKEAEGNLKNAVNKSNMTTIQKDRVNDVISATSTKNKIQAISDERNKVIDNINEIASQFSSPEQFAIRNQLQDFARNYKNTGVLDTNFINSLDGLVSTNQVSNAMASDVLAAANNVENLVKNLASEGKIDGITVATASGAVTGAIIGAAVSDSTRKQESAQTAFDNVKEKSSDTVKQNMDTYVSASEVINKEIIKQTKKSENDKYDNKYKNRVSNAESSSNNSQSTSNYNSDTSTNQRRNAQDINVGNINANNVNTNGTSGSSNTNDPLYEDGSKGRLNQRDINNLKDAFRSGARSEDMIDAINDLNDTVKNNWNNQNYDRTYETGFDTNKVNEGRASLDQTESFYNDIFDDFYDPDEDENK